ncbi:MAG: YceI family protein [Vulcanimicrobiaceae bacterium]
MRVVGRRAVATLVCLLTSAAYAPAVAAPQPAPPSGAATAPATSRAFDLGRSRATFDVTHLFVQHVGGKIPIVDGRATFAAPDARVPTHVEASLDPAGVRTDDADRDEDLHGPDWFDVARYPTWTFASGEIAPTATGFTMAGTFTMHGVARPVTLAVTVLQPPPHAHYRATATLDRHAFGMRVTRFDATIGNDVDLVLDIQLK